MKTRQKSAPVQLLLFIWNKNSKKFIYLVDGGTEINLNSKHKGNGFPSNQKQKA